MTTISLLLILLLVIRNLVVYRRPKSSSSISTSISLMELVSVCVPARNEEANIAACLEGIQRQSYSNLEILVLDDCSDDRTPQILCEIAAKDPRVKILSGKPISPGWAGKCHACHQLGLAATGEYLLFMDADTRSRPDLIECTVAHLKCEDVALLSGFPHQITGTFWELVVLPMLQFLITTLLPLDLVRRTQLSAFSAACGQFLLFRKSAYLSIGGHGSIRSSFHDGLQLSRKLKVKGFKIGLCDLTGLMACRMYEGGRALWNGFTRNAFEGVGSIGALMGMTYLLVTLFLMPFVFAVYGAFTGAKWEVLCIVQIGVILTIRILQCIRFGYWRSMLLFPLAVTAVVAIQWGSFWNHLRGMKVAWKGRGYADLDNS